MYVQLYEHVRDPTPGSSAGRGLALDAVLPREPNPHQVNNP